MKTSRLTVFVILLFALPTFAAEDDGGFHSIAEHKAAVPSLKYDLVYDDIDDLFDTRDITGKLAAEKRVRLFRKPEKSEGLDFAYANLELKYPLKEVLGTKLPTVEIAETAFRPALTLATDFNNYGEISICAFDPGVALLVGGDEPDYILVCCFTCHDIRIIRRPTADHPMPQIAVASMSPELESALFALAREAYPDDKALQSSKLAERIRSKTPIPKQTEVLKDPFSSEQAAPEKQLR